jgi:hypothetical protein
MGSRIGNIITQQRNNITRQIVVLGLRLSPIWGILKPWTGGWPPARMEREMTKIAINGYKAAYLMFDSGLGENAVQNGIYEIPQPTKGYYYVSDVMDYIKKAGV